MTAKGSAEPSGEATFEAELDKLGAAVEKLEGGDLSLDVALQCFEDGIQSLRRCYSVLEGAQKRIETLCAEVETRSPEGGGASSSRQAGRWKRADFDTEIGGKSLPRKGIGSEAAAAAYSSDFAEGQAESPSERPRQSFDGAEDSGGGTSRT